ncbi:PpiC-type peptidyl-prolyl cis-trans isomerase [Tolypothrix tenuis PCC 7101]|uniref:peptidylprolyl isomerase n=1 Tax=Tolypothrix tenuis PCC 7101 TaxID=231146 RepID=A0A1Z4N5V1_9CYAN|nr:peptidylprolyl isomerase [Aulosira sp. FACHB-113]BAZ01084.1 PpiC-type peptidyl-prolyl cis-trans isomerase [Tolypothrix tenuis PCC 7101]BAZ74994.1 PpiC-type peptidyl-prolyl cis-trans isomerase [Aulosira laxa NIES-50]
MTEQLEQTLSLKVLPQEPVKPHPVSDAEILAYLRHSAKFAEVAVAAEREALVLANCNQLGIEVSDDEWQAAGDAFRLERKLWGNTETLAWLEEQRINVEEWSQGIKVALLENKLKEYLFGATVDGAYISNRDNYRRVALSQILLTDLATAWKIVQLLREGEASFCALALEHSKGKQSQENGGFVGIRYLVELIPEIAEPLSQAKEGEIIGPVQTKMGYHVLRVEKWFPIELNQGVRQQIMDSLFDAWLQNLKTSHHEGE